MLLEVLNKVGWRVGIPPMVIDRNGHPHDLLLTPWMLLRHLLEDAWLCYVGSALTCSSMSSLSGIDGYVVEWGNSTLTSLERSLQSALQSGAFMDAWTQGKFDVTKNKISNQCHCPQTQEHVLVCPKHRDSRDQFFLTKELDQLPRHLALHLLCQRPLWIDDLRACFLGLPDNTEDFVSAPSGSGTQHLFTDGSHTADGRFETRRAACMGVAQCHQPRTHWLRALSRPATNHCSSRAYGSHCAYSMVFALEGQSAHLAGCT